jgi:hypothetical protein
MTRTQPCLFALQRVPQPLEHPAQKLLPFGIIQIGVARA